MKPTGYIVINESMGNAATLLKQSNAIWKGVPEKGILLLNEHRATIFEKRGQARAAIRRTHRYFIKKAAREELDAAGIATRELTIRKLFPA